MTLGDLKLGEGSLKSGIYKIYSINTGESYYGSTRNLVERFREHKCKFKKNQGNYKMRALLAQYGIENFIFEVLERCATEDFLTKEKLYIDSDPKHLNVWVNPNTPYGCQLGSSVKGKKFFGTPHTEEAKQKMRTRMKNHYLTNESYWKGKSHSKESRNMIAESLKKHYKENGHPNKGKPLKEETKQKISETLKKRSINVFI